MLVDEFGVLLRLLDDPLVSLGLSLFLATPPGPGRGSPVVLPVLVLLLLLLQLLLLPLLPLFELLFALVVEGWAPANDKRKAITLINCLVYFPVRSNYPCTQSPFPIKLTAFD